MNIRIYTGIIAIHVFYSIYIITMVKLAHYTEHVMHFKEGQCSFTIIIKFGYLQLFN